eukprot:CAMPEP_0197824716 /NCGR_PEP_ID=MMETSP1437-20131217/1934_1 /TAXON_ID=49252 ORGANISM="Eucampia antarctica, Strain CCMP1452" /NCGR_SAMPLE_ID=MMETSP1437 /ASSEMBLY_ACC=CAM_ASM_001096 /LENGTH=916 /DNA_ID=CAMNT_0043424457 /DNA_START=54 /DNA_END=2804 /DNA_ORIENTATION=+
MNGGATLDLVTVGSETEDDNNNIGITMMGGRHNTNNNNSEINRNNNNNSSNDAIMLLPQCRLQSDDNPGDDESPPPFDSEDDEEDEASEEGESYSPVAVTPMFVPSSLPTFRLPMSQRTSATSTSSTITSSARMPSLLSPPAEDCAPLLLLSLPVDGLHSIAGFLKCPEWANFGLASHAANRACREVFKRVKMHGFRCAAEVVAAWIRGQQSDARELCALYIKNRVPIHPQVLGHAYHTLHWRMNREARAMESEWESHQQREQQEEASSSEDPPPPCLDLFYAHRYEFRSSEGSFVPSFTYLEEKSLFHKHKKIKDKGIMSLERRHSLAFGVPLRPSTPSIMVFPPSQHYRSHSIGPPMDGPQTQKHHQPIRLKISVPTHRHLLDQHLLGNAGTTDEGDLLRTASFCLSADFFHPVDLLPMNQEVMQDVSLEVYSCASLDSTSDTMITMFKYQKKMASLLNNYDTTGFDECLIDFWDEFFPITSGVLLYDKSTPVPRMSRLENFLTRPCPPSWGSIQCEIERIKTSSKKKIKGRFFPTYEYRLFIRDRRYGQPESQVQEGELPSRNDTVVMVARNKGGHKGTTKRGVNSYYLYMPDSNDAESHYSSVNAKTTTQVPSFPHNAKLSQHELGRLQSNFIGTEFQIFTPEHHDKPIFPCDSELDTTIGGPPRWRRLPRSLSRSRSNNRRSLSTENCGSDEQDADTANPSDPKTSQGGRRTATWSSIVKSRSSRRAIADSATRPPLGPDEFECGAITYTANLLGNRPRIMDVCIPRVNSNENSVSGVWKRHVERTQEETNMMESMLYRFKQIQLQQQQQQNDQDGLINDADALGLTALQNRPPWWNVDLGAFVLNFGGRVSVASVKNFQLCDKNNQEHIMLQFGRIQGRHSFTMDFQYPLSPVQAFAIAISSLQSKISFG